MVLLNSQGGIGCELALRGATIVPALNAECSHTFRFEREIGLRRAPRRSFQRDAVSIE